MKRTILLSLILLGCSTQTEPSPKPQLDGGSHTLPHATPCHSGETESQGNGGILECRAA